jgi:hypothetical protein
VNESWPRSGQPRTNGSTKQRSHKFESLVKPQHFLQQKTKRGKEGAILSVFGFSLQFLFLFPLTTTFLTLALLFSRASILRSFPLAFHPGTSPLWLDVPLTADIITLRGIRQQKIDQRLIRANVKRVN